WRRYGNFQWEDKNGITTADWIATTFTPPASTCPGADNRTAAAACPAVTYYQPAFQQPTVFTYANAPGYNRTYNGFEVTGRKRMSNHWLMNTSFSFNSIAYHYGEFAGSNNMSSGTAATNPLTEDPTNRAVRNNQQYDYLTSGSGIGNVFVNAKWLFKLSGLYNLPYDINVSAFYNARQGYPFERIVQGPSRANGAGIPLLLLDAIGDSRLPTYQNLDFHVERPVKVGTVRFIPSLDVFNVKNNNT